MHDVKPSSVTLSDALEMIVKGLVCTELGRGDRAGRAGWGALCKPLRTKKGRLLSRRDHTNRITLFHPAALVLLLVKLNWKHWENHHSIKEIIIEMTH